MNGKLKKSEKETIVTYFKVLTQHLPGKIKENHKTLRQSSQCPNQDTGH
jgi:hypothetical protein